MITLGPIPHEEPLRFEGRRQLLVDNDTLCDWWKVRRVQEKVRKHPLNPIVTAGAPWEADAKAGLGVYPVSALYDEQDGLYKLWYWLPGPPNTASVVAYATSADGVHFDKPLLRLVEYAGTMDNNVCRAEPYGKPLNALHLVVDRRSKPAERRFEGVALTPRHEDGTTYGGWSSPGHSADGVVWRVLDGGTRAGAGGGSPSCVWDECIGKYVVFHRQIVERAMPQKLASSIGRYIIRQESDDLIEWSPRQTVFNPMDPEWPEVESMMVFCHQGMYLGFPQMLENEIRGEVELHLITSRDGFRWDHPFPREAFVPLGPRGDFDDFCAWFGLAVIDGDQVKIYYGGSQHPHSKPIAGASADLVGERKNAVGLATVPRDRFFGLRMDEPWGGFLTRPFIVEGDDLYVNAIVDRELRVEVIDPVGRLVDIGAKAHIGHYIKGEESVYEGYDRGSCAPLPEDALRCRVSWNGGGLGRFKGQAIRLRFVGRMATVYAYWME